MPNFVSFATSVAELAHGEKSRTQSLSHSTRLFDATGTKAFASENDIMNAWAYIHGNSEIGNILGFTFTNHNIT